MSVLRDRCLAGVLLASCALIAHGAEHAPAKVPGKAAAPDLDFLEYLGTLESDEDNWTDVVNVELPVDAPVSAKSAETKPQSGGQKGKPKAEAAAKSAGSEK